MPEDSMDKSDSQGLYIFYLNPNFFSKKKAYFQGVCRKVSDNCLTSQLPEVAVPMGANKRLAKKHERKIWSKCI